MLAYIVFALLFHSLIPTANASPIRIHDYEPSRINDLPGKHQILFRERRENIETVLIEPGKVKEKTEKEVVGYKE